MSKGSPIIKLRLPAEVLAMIDEQVAKSVGYSFDEPYTRSSWVRACIMERFEKYRRAKEAGIRTRQKKAAAKLAAEGDQVEQPDHQVEQPAAGDQVEQQQPAAVSLDAMIRTGTPDEVDVFIRDLFG
jgi:Arc/MetJ-type ribon-helix-helix transcriptional regulator